MLVQHSHSDISHARFKEALEGVGFFSFDRSWVCLGEKRNSGYETAREKIWYIPELLEIDDFKMSQRDNKVVVYDSCYAILFEYDKSVFQRMLRHTD